MLVQSNLSRAHQLTSHVFKLLLVTRHHRQWPGACCWKSATQSTFQLQPFYLLSTSFWQNRIKQPERHHPMLILPINYNQFQQEQKKKISVCNNFIGLFTFKTISKAVKLSTLKKIFLLLSFSGAAINHPLPILTLFQTSSSTTLSYASFI